MIPDLPSYTVVHLLLILGLILNKLRKHENETVAAQAKEIFRHWKAHFRQHQDKPKIEVRCDNKTIKFRHSGRKLLEGALQPSAVSNTEYTTRIVKC